MRLLRALVVAGILGLALIGVGRAQVGVPPAPSDLTAVNFVAGHFVGLTWRNNADNADGYQIERSTVSADGPWQIIATIPLVISKCDRPPCYFDSPSLNISYGYRVAAKNSAGLSGYSNVVWIGLPAAPSNLRIEGANLVWNDDATNEEAYRIRKAVGAGPAEVVALVLANVTSVPLPATAPDEQCAGVTFTVVAVTGSGESSPSNAVHVQATDCAAPSPTPARASTPIGRSDLPSAGSGPVAEGAAGSQIAVGFLALAGAVLFGAGLLAARRR